MANALWTWGVARATAGRVLLRIEDHDRQRCRPAYDAALLEDLAWLGFTPDLGPVRQSDPDAQDAYAAALAQLRADDLVYGCACTRTTFRGWADEHGRAWSGPGCPGSCRERGLAGPVVRVALGGGSETWMDGLVGPCSDEVAPAGDLPIRDRHGNWTYGFCVVVDDLRQGVDLVVRGRDLLACHARPRSAWLGSWVAPPRRSSSTTGSSADRMVRSSRSRPGIPVFVTLRAAGVSAADMIGRATAATGFADQVAGSGSVRSSISQA